MIRCALALLVVALAPASASADTYCVQKPACTGTDVSAGLQAALNAAAAHAGADRVEVGPTPAPLSGEFTYFGAGALDIVGAGVGVSTLTQPSSNPGAGYILTAAGSTVTVSDLSFALPAGTTGRGLRLAQGSSARHVAVTGDAGTENAFGVSVLGGTLDASTVTLPGDNVGVSLDADGARLQDSAVTSGSYTVRSEVPGGTTSVRGVRIDAAYVGLAVTLGTLNAEDVVVDTRGHKATGLYAGDGNGNTGVVTLDGRHVTVLADQSNTVGATVGNSSANESAVIHLRDSVIAGAGRPLVRYATKGSASIDTAYSAYPAPVPADLSGGGTLSEEHHLTAAPLLAADGVPTAASPLLDAGTPGALGAGERTTDASGHPRFVAGTGCDARRDIGALEFQPTTLTVAASAPATAKAGDAVTYSAAGSCDPDPAATPAYAWSFDDGTKGAGPTVDHAWTTGGTHVATLTVTGGAGRTGTAAASVDVTAPPVATASPTPSSTPTATATPTGAPGGDTVAPVLSRLSRRAFSLSEAAAVVLTLRRGHHKARRLVVTVAAGRTRLHLLAKRPGRYRLTATPTDAAGNRGRTVRIRFTIARG